MPQMPRAFGHQSAVVRKHLAIDMGDRIVRSSVFLSLYDKHHAGRREADLKYLTARCNTGLMSPFPPRYFGVSVFRTNTLIR